MNNNQHIFFYLLYEKIHKLFFSNSYQYVKIATYISKKGEHEQMIIKVNGMVGKKVCAGLAALAIVTCIVGTPMGESVNSNNTQHPLRMTVHADEDSNNYVDDSKIHTNAFWVEDSGMSNEYLRLISYSNGRFRLNTTEGDPLISSDNDKLLLYDGDTSYSTIVIDGDVKIFGDSEMEEPIYDFENESQIRVCQYDDITVKQILTFANNTSTGRRDVLEIKYEITNNGTDSHTIGTRIMLDTMLGDNDSAPFRVPGMGNLTTEKEYSGDGIPQYWQAFDNLTNPTVISQGSFLRDTNNQPDKVQFTNWGRVESTPWNYEVLEGSDNDDSAVSIIWNEKELSAGETRTYSTYYGLSELTQDVEPPLAVSMYCDNTAVFDAFQNKYMPIDVTAYIENIGEGAANNAFLRIELPAEMELGDYTGESDEGVDVEFFDSLNVGEIESRTWHINISNSIENGRTYPIKIICGADGIEEKTIVREITIPEHETNGDTIDNRIDWGQEQKDFWGNGTDKYPGIDNLKFTNSKENIANYKISAENLRNLTINANMENTVYNYIKNRSNKKFDGSCYGMSVVVALAKTGHIHPERWRDDGNSSKILAHDLEIPINDTYSQNLIHYYHLMYSLPDVTDVGDNFEHQFMNSDDFSSANDSEVLKELVHNAGKVKNGGYPIVTNIAYLKYKSIDISELEIKDDNGKNVNNVSKEDFSNLDVVKSLLTEGHWYNDTYGEKLEFTRDDFSIVGNDIYVNGKHLREITDKDTIWLADEKGMIGSCYKRANVGVHAILAYDVDRIDKSVDFNGKTKNFTYRVSICDPNYLDHWTYLYVCDDYSEWYYEDMKVNGDSKEGNLCISSSGTPYQMMYSLISDISKLDVVNIETHESRAVLHNYNRNFIKSYSSSVGSVYASDGRQSKVGIINGDGNLPLSIRYDIGETTEGVNSQNSTITLPEGDEISYVITPKNNVLDSSINYTNYMFSIYAEASNSAKYDPSGFVEVDLNNSDFELEATFNDGYGNLPWFTMKANGEEADWAKLTIADEGFILESDNLKNTTANGSNADGEVNVSFSTDEKAVQLKAIDDDTLGVYIDADDNGTYETLIADSDGTDYTKDGSNSDDSSLSTDDSSSSTTDDSSSNNSSSTTTTDNSFKRQFSTPNTSSNNSDTTSPTTNPTSTSGTNSYNTNNPKTGDRGEPTKTLGIAAMMLSIIAILKKKKQ